MLATEMMQMFTIIYYVILYMSQVISFEDIHFLIRVIELFSTIEKKYFVFSKNEKFTNR